MKNDGPGERLDGPVWRLDSPVFGSRAWEVWDLPATDYYLGVLLRNT